MAKGESERGLGHYGEELAAALLQERGMIILARNWRRREGEIDIVAKEGEDFVFVEVKTRRSHRYGWPEDSISQRKIKKLIQLALMYLEDQGEGHRNWRLDAVAVDLDPAGQLIRIDHYENIGGQTGDWLE